MRVAIPGATVLWRIGVDAGATRCRARARDADWNALAEANGSAANVHVDFDAAIAVMRTVVGEVLAKAGLGEADRARMGLGFGIAGLNDESDAARVVGAFPGFGLVRAANDATTACIGAHSGADGGLVIAGTGSAAIARVLGRETIVGGRGFTLGDDGSAAHIGLDALRAAILAYDGLGPASALTAAIFGEFGDDAVSMLRWARAAKPSDFGAFAPQVFKHATEGDPIAIKIAARAARAISALIRRVVALGAERVAVVGGVGEALHPYLDPEIGAHISAPQNDATDGAILLVGGVIANRREAVR